MFLCQKRNRWKDGWTYGDWRQYVCQHADGSTQCARIALLLPFGWAVMRPVGPPNDGDRRVLYSDQDPRP